MNSILFRRLLLVTLFITLSFASGCQPQPTSNAPNAGGQWPVREQVTGRRGGSLTYAISAPPKTFNYMAAADEFSVFLSFYLLGGRLVEFDHDKQDYVPALAESWKLSDDARSADLTLRDGLKFSDGHPLTADDVAFTFRALYDERTGSPIYRDATLVGGKPIEVSVLDARHLHLVFPEAVAAPENYLANINVMPRHILEADFNKGTMGKAYDISTDPQRIVTSGIFTVESVTPGERYTLKRNPNYWKKDAAGTQLPYLDNFVLEVVSDQNNAITRLGQGTLDIVDRIRPTDYASLRNAQGAVRSADLGPGLYTDDFWFNLSEGQQDGKPFVDPVKLAWFSDVRFRRAVSHAIDRESIATNTWQGLATPLYGFVSVGNHAWVANDLPRTEYSLDKARALLTEAGFKMGGTQDAPELMDAKGHRVEFTVIVQSTNELRARTATVIQEDLARLGIKMQLAPIDTTQLQSRLQSRDYEAIFYGASVTEPDPSSYNDFLRSDSPQHFWSPKEPKPATDWEAKLDELTVAQSHETNAERRRAIFRDIQMIMAEQLPLIPVVTRHIPVAANMRIGNYRPSPLPPFSLWNVEELFLKQ